MARYTGPVCKLCRREGMKLNLKGERCATVKCAFERRGYAPGQHGQNRRFKQSNFGVQLREKQKIRRIYGLMERQFHNTYKRAVRQKGVTGEQLLVNLESRLDTIVYRLGLAPSLSSARQLVNHGHFRVNRRKVDIPSYLMKPGDRVQVRESSRKLDIIHQAMQRTHEDSSVPYLELDKAKMEGEYVAFPKRDEIPVTALEQYVVELYSR